MVVIILLSAEKGVWNYTFKEPVLYFRANELSEVVIIMAYELFRRFNSEWATILP